MSIRINPATKFTLLIIAFFFFVSIAIDHAFVRKTLNLTWYASLEGIHYSTLTPDLTNDLDTTQTNTLIKAILIDNNPVYIPSNLETDMNRILTSRQSLETWKQINKTLTKAFSQNSKIQLLTSKDGVVDTSYYNGIKATTKFTLLIFCASVVFIICAYLFSFAPRTPTIQLLMFSATCFAIFTVLEAVLPIGEITPVPVDSLYWALIARNWCFLSFIGIIAIYPKRLINPKIIAGWSLAQPLLLYLDLYTQFPAALSNHINTVYGFMFLPAFLLQWKRCQSDKTDQIAMKIIFYSFIVPTVFFMLLFIVSTFVFHMAFFQQTTISLIYLSVCLSLMWMAFKNKILNIEKYWFKPWIWTLSGSLLLIGLLFIANILELSYLSSFFIALTLFIGALLPIQKYLSEKISSKNIEHLFPEIMKIIDENGETDEKWRKILTLSFSPLQISESSETMEKSRIFQEGHSMLVNSPIVNSRVYRISGKHRGESLFSRQDIEFIDTISDVFRSKSAPPKPNTVESPHVLPDDPNSDFEIELNRIINQNIYSENLSPKFIAEEMALSLRALQLKTKKELNLSPREIITKRKMEKAALLLSERTDHINQIAYQLCYENPAYFTRQFKAYYGVTPREHRLTKTEPALAQK